MDFLSEHLLSTAYRDRLHADLRRADICRFLVGYVSENGLTSIGRAELVRALRNEYSFGVSSLTCSCGYTPLLGLQKAIGESTVRLKYFMDPLVKETEEPVGIGLFHSKLVYLRLKEEGTSVVYIGSHNWTGRGLGVGRPRNVEASLRFELDYSDEHISGAGNSIVSEVNRHLLSAYETPVCIPAILANEVTFQQWFDKGCRRQPNSELEAISVLLAVRTDKTPISHGKWNNVTSIYVQALEDVEGEKLCKGTEAEVTTHGLQIESRTLIMVWESLADLQHGIPPFLFRCHVSTHNPGPNSQRGGSNAAPTPIAGYGAAIYDAGQLTAMQKGSRAERSSIRLWSGREVELFDFTFCSQPSEPSQIDGTVQPMHQILLEVDGVVTPSHHDPSADSAMVWTTDSFAVAKSIRDARLQRVEGYYVEPSKQDEIMRYLAEELLIDMKHATVLPVSDIDRAKEGRRVSQHPLHDTFLGEAVRQEREAYYSNTKRGALVADIDRPPTGGEKTPQNLFDESVERVQRLFTMNLDTLERAWGEIARGRRVENS